MSDKKDQIEQDTQASIAIRKALTRQFVAYEFEHEAGNQIAKIKKKLDRQSNASDSTQSNIVIVDCDEVYVQDTKSSVGSIIKTKAVNLHPQYHSLVANNKAIVSLGLNSILDISFTYPDSQSTLFTSQQWDELRRKYKPKKYNTSEYAHIKPILAPIFKEYSDKKTTDANWINMYKQVKSLEKTHDPELSPDNNDISFCIYFILQTLLIIKHQPDLFNPEIDSSEWDFVVKFWGLITERLFYRSHLRLKWGDTHLTMHDTICDSSFKVDLRILHDKIKQRYNTENDVAIMEAAVEGSGNAKFVSDRFKLSIEKQGLYITTQFHYQSITKSLKDLAKYMDLAVGFLHFRDNCIITSNAYENHLTCLQDKKRSGKRSVDNLQDDKLTSKQEAIRGTWNPPHSPKSPLPAVPKNLWKAKKT
ncbi:hypothetical protein RO3G_10373 [Rhizopus delemar RA 99-880]|uniref:Uncharacterized protein n=1 Tax=Rhizopus delemar (strain RA 99-880 / ATCC MYA-4621 / FGSC 9543 / NRRL 43880) TaxID=246409 RepID=I1CB33_RHIO9|nr:hypothetical protein RO3G_10373 [Rhizopus delemar RA 99-880]|eukprot:EIE85663.1 hypothetical protein RO3G_10373 [Rhizopus delemar RA 99-880]